MSNKLNLSVDASDKLNDLSRMLELRRNIVCRIAVGRSLADGKLEFDKRTKTLDDFFDNNKGFEFNRYTLTGEYDDYFKAMIVQAQGQRITDDEYFRLYLRKHIERGVEIMYKEYQRVGSNITYLSKLANGEKMV